MTMQAANTNVRPVTGGRLFHPEMGETAAASVLMIGCHVYRSTYAVQWSPDRHDEALAAFKTCRVRSRSMECREKADGGRKWSALVTSLAFDKLLAAKVMAWECLLD